MVFTKEMVEKVLADPERTKAVVIAAFKAREVLTTADDYGKTPDGDGALMVARNTIDAAIVLAPALALANLRERVGTDPAP